MFMPKVNNNAQGFNVKKSQRRHTLTHSYMRTRALAWPINSVSINMAETGGAAAFTRIRQILEHTLASSPVHSQHFHHLLPALDKFFLQFNAYTN